METMNGERKAGSTAAASCAELDAINVRNLLVRSFSEVLREKIAAAKLRLGRASGDEEIRQSVETTVKMAFQTVGAEFSRPTKSSLSKVIDILRHKVSLWGMPPEVVDRHTRVVAQALNHLP